MNIETVIELLKDIQQDYIDIKDYYTALEIAIEKLESEGLK